MQTEKLQPCPFCGGKAILVKNTRAFIKAQTTRVAYVHCINCNARTNRVPLEKYGKTAHSREAQEEATTAWNRRTEISPREMAKKPKYAFTKTLTHTLEEFLCAECETELSKFDNYCYTCGQALDWIDFDSDRRK